MNSFGDEEKSFESNSESRDGDGVMKGIAWENAWRAQQGSCGMPHEAWVERWEELARDGLLEPLSWALAGLPPAVVSAWMERVARHGWEQWVALQWAASGVRVERMFVDAGVCPQERPVVERHLPRWGAIRRWLTPPTPTMVRLALLEGWAQHGVPADVADRWRRLGFFLPEDALRWRNIGFSPLEAAQWELVGVSAADAVATRVHHIWVEVEDNPVDWDDAESWGEWEEPWEDPWDEPRSW